ncbi:MAG TPA: nucleotidyltransferase domain-containing protein [Actinomycetes bacterium]|nr:nucleotidyltransferase domain-containing protein [Actinomycetes bacterium]
MRLAGELAELLLERHGPAAIAAVGVHGPVARGDDTDASDLDLAVVTAGPEVEVPDRSLRYRGAVVDLGAIGADAYLEEASHIGPAWPLAADQYVNHLAIHDPGGFFHKLKHVHEAAVEEAGAEVFAAAAGFDLVQLLSWEATAQAAELAGDVATTLVAVKESAVLAALVVGLHTRTAYRNLAHALHATAATGAAGPGFAEAYRRLLDPTAEPAVQVLALGRVRDALLALAGREGIPFEAAGLDAFL